ncbi:hypothetical protein MOO45_07540 [Bombilactobacillus folatiphilus]|uniref:Uncharacterized protein n=1 Tax=Bombilactobacillus folatiphilus TaxID=2923362 RepID=A0ABY4P9G5_9LACO|nr:hypothetical protein [Bombilactobacillus folatiphilus]UQS82032.1 hypothetical protein MOO45_07540 [Bombilactobacillus folatiphilus]
MKRRTFFAIIIALSMNLWVPVSQSNSQTRAQEDNFQPKSEINVNHREQATKTIKQTTDEPTPQAVVNQANGSTGTSQASVTITDPDHASSYSKDEVLINQTIFKLENCRGNDNLPVGKIYQWQNAPTDNWFLLERTTSQADIVQNLQMNSTIIVKQKSYHIYNIVQNKSVHTGQLTNIQEDNGGLIIQVQTIGNHKIENSYIFAK